MSNQESPFIWVDLEMTDLNPDVGFIIEIAVVITDRQLNMIAALDDSIVIHLSDEILNNMNEWCIKHHGESGLTERSRNSKISLAEAEELVLQFLRKNGVPVDGVQDWDKKPLIAGNTVWMDKLFIEKYMPRFNNALHYRVMDVSTVKELCRRWYPDLFAKMEKKKNPHRALGDILESIEELRYYKQAIFK